MVKKKVELLDFTMWSSHTIKFKSMNKSSEKLFETIGKKVHNLLCHSGCKLQNGTYFSLYLFGNYTSKYVVVKIY